MKVSVPSADASGSTACVLLVQGHKLITANVGNSRAILVNKHRKVRQLSDDHTLSTMPKERRRVEELGGRIDPKTNRILSSSKKEQGKGLHISRSIGDFTLHKAGIVIAEPEIKHFNLEEDDQILILASDGIWDKMKVQNVA